MRYIFELAVDSKLLAPHAGRCLVCACTDAQACAGGCTWVDVDHLLCSSCWADLTLVKPLRLRSPSGWRPHLAPRPLRPRQKKGPRP